jgi:hypothetical protein
LNNVSAVWKPFLSDDSIATLRQFGGYIEPFKKNLQILSLNTLIYDTDNLNAYDPLYGDDPMHQFAWAEAMLQKGFFFFFFFFNFNFFNSAL